MADAVAATCGRPAEKTRPSVFWPLAAIVVPLTALLRKIEIIDGARSCRARARTSSRRTTTPSSIRSIVALAVWRHGPRAAVHGEGEPVPGARARAGRCGPPAWCPSRARRPRPPRGRRSRPPRRSSSTAAASSSTPRARSRATPTVADARQDRCRPAGAGRRHPAHPDGPLGRARTSCPRYGKLKLLAAAAAGAA